MTITWCPYDDTSVNFWHPVGRMIDLKAATVSGRKRLISGLLWRWFDGALTSVWRVVWSTDGQIFFQILLHLSCLFFPLSRCRIRTNPLPPDEGKCVNHRTHGRLHVCCKKFAKNRYKKTFNKRTDDILQQLYFEGDETTKSVLTVYFPKPIYFFATLLRAKLYQIIQNLQHIKRPSEVNNLAHQNA